MTERKQSKEEQKAEEWLLYAEFEGRNLDMTEIEVLSYLIAKTENGKTGLSSAIRFIARDLNHNTSLVRSALVRLQKLKLIGVQFCEQEGYAWNVYTVNMELLRKKRSEFKAV